MREGFNPAPDQESEPKLEGSITIDELLAFYQIPGAPRKPVFDKASLRDLPRAERVAAEKRYSDGIKREEQRIKEGIESFSKAFIELTEKDFERIGAERAREEGQIAELLSRQLGISLYRPPTVVRIAGREPFVQVDASMEFNGSGTRWLRAERLADGSFNYTVGDYDTFPRDNTLSDARYGQHFLNWINELFKDHGLHVERKQTDSGYFSGSYSRAQRVEVSVSAQTRSKEQAVRQAQALLVARRLISAMDAEISRRAADVTKSDWTRGAYELGGEMYLADFVHEKALESLKKFFLSPGALDFMGPGAEMSSVEDINVNVGPDSMRARVTYKTQRPYLGRMVLQTQDRLLERIPLPHRIPELEIDSIELSEGDREYSRTTEKRRIVIPPLMRPIVDVPYYNRFYRPDQDIRKQLLDALEEWFKEQRAKSGRRGGGRELAPPNKLVSHLAAVGLTIDNLKGKSLKEQRILVQKRWRELVKMVHPDVNKNDATATGEIARINSAYDFLKDENHLLKESL